MPNPAPASEQQFLELIDRHFPGGHPHMPVARGDDCAVINCPEAMVLSTDLFLEDVHFRRSYFEPRDIGWKSLAVNISDIAGMGCRPLGFSLGLMVPDNAADGDFWDDLFSGMAELAGRYDLPLTGGDLSSSPILGMSVCIWGEPGPQGRILERETCRPGDTILLCGQTGLVRAGLMALEKLGKDAAGDYPQAVAAHLRPAPQIKTGLALAAHPGTTAAMDLSDGPAMDLPRLLGTTMGADITLAPATLHPETVAWCETTGEDPALFAFKGGEDYALLATATPDAAVEIIAANPTVRAIGTVTDSPGITVNGTPAQDAGFDHFAS